MKLAEWYSAPGRCRQPGVQHPYWSRDAVHKMGAMPELCAPCMTLLSVLYLAHDLVSRKFRLSGLPGKFMQRVN